MKKSKASVKSEKADEKKTGKAERLTRSSKKEVKPAEPESQKKPETKKSNKSAKSSGKSNEEPEAKPLLDPKVDLVDGNKEVTVHSKYTLSKDHPLFDSIEGLLELLRQKQKHKDQKLFRKVEFTYYPTFEFELQNQKPNHDKCCICQFEFDECSDYEKQLKEEKDEDIVALKCCHMLHKGCVQNMVGDKLWIRCPVCFTIFGEMIGDQPPGKMSWHVVDGMHCDGYPDVGTINIGYQMSSGVRNGVHFQGTSRHAYLPDNPEGNQVLQLFKKAFDRKLIFTVGTSVTTGRDNCVVWNGIHHKTNLHGGSSHFGFPDPTYFQRVKMELAMKGVS